MIQNIIHKKIIFYHKIYKKKRTKINIDIGFMFKFQIFSNKKEYDITKYDTVEKAHKGEIKCIVYDEILKYKNKVIKYAITGSVDRTIKVWYVYAIKFEFQFKKN